MNTKYLTTLSQNASRLAALGLVLASASTYAQTNSWINPASGAWDDATSWSSGILPDSSQSILITNTGWKAVVINPSSPVASPASMTISNLFIQGATNTENTLLLNYFGTGVPLTVLNGITLQDDGRLLDLNSGLVVEGGTIVVTNSQIGQDGGFVNITNAQLHLSSAEYDLTNGDFEGGVVWVGTGPTHGQFNQYGGTATIATLDLGTQALGSIGAYSLYGGNLNLPNGLTISGAVYFQSGGTNQTAQVTIQPGYANPDTFFELNDGLLADNNVSLLANGFGTVTITQNGGSHVVTNSLLIEGGAPNGNYVNPATYSLNGGLLSAGSIELDADPGDSVLAITNANVNAGTLYVHSLGFFGSHNTTVSLAGGSLNCSNFTTVDGGGKLNQTGGALVVSNLLDFGGSRYIGITLNATYTFTSGTVSASNINLSGIWIIGDGNMNNITNPGNFSLAYKLQIGNATEQLGKFILVSNATINLAGSASQLSFANSSGESWASGTTLVVSNWNGSLSGGGAEQLKFGTDQTGLTAAQLDQIEFNYSGKMYPAKILNSGEVVPDLGLATVAYSRQGKNLVLTWPAGWTLQTSTNLSGAFMDVTATSPYTNDTTLDPQRFFRLRQ